MTAKKADTIKRFEYSTLGNELEKQTNIANDEYKFLKDQKNVINNNKEDDAKSEDNKTNNVGYRYTGYKYKNLINKIFIYR